MLIAILHRGPAAWEIAAAIIAELGGERITEPLRGEWEKLRGLDAEQEGVLIDEL
jgi:hypothetical protein